MAGKIEGYSVIVFVPVVRTSMPEEALAIAHDIRAAIKRQLVDFEECRRGPIDIEPQIGRDYEETV